MSDTTPPARLARLALAEALAARGPAAPTLCEGWTTLDLAAHVVVRERRPDSLPGLAGGPLRRWSEAVRLRAAAGGLESLVSALRSGPPAWSVFAVPGVDERANLLEYVIHHEDVRRGTPDREDWTPALPPAVDAAVWRALAGAGPLLLRAVRGGVVLVRPGGPSRTVRSGNDPLTLTGTPVDLALLAFGRREAADVLVTGSPAARARLESARLRA